MMRVDPRLSSGPRATSSPRTGAGARFTLGRTAAAPVPVNVQAAASLASISALLALQSDEAGDRRRLSLRRGHDLLDRLDKLKAGLLAGRVDAASLHGLAKQLATAREASGDAGLDEVLAQIELRAQVELAKLERGSA
jgi:hypothetical protein